MIVGIGLLFVAPVVLLGLLLQSQFNMQVGLPLAAAAVLGPFVTHIVLQRRLAMSDDAGQKAMATAMRAMLILALFLWGVGTVGFGLCIALLVQAY